jgi:peptidoglycan/xylan/chitin deacetylase (PgdA/CDA1 family)
VVKALQFHRITPKFQFCGTWNGPRQFENFLEFLRTHHIQPILPGEKEDGITITFDDGEKSIYEYAFPILRKFGFKALVFLIVDYIGKENLWDISLTGRHVQHLSWDEVIEMKEWGIEYGSHTLTHRNLTKLSNEEISYELTQSKRILAKKIGECNCVSYPFNRVNAQIINAAKDAGYKYGFGGDGSNDFLLKKEAIYITDNLKSLEVKIFEKPKYIYNYERVKQKVINYFTIATMMSKKRQWWV